MAFVFTESEFLNGGFGDLIKIANVSIFAISNGYLQTLCCCWAPQLVEDNDQENVGIMVGLAINVGILSGSVV